MKLNDSAPPIVRLPLEILDIFISRSSQTSQLSLSHVSKLFHSLAIRWLYHDISLNSPKVVIECCRTLVARPDTAAAVRYFSIEYTLSPPFSSHPSTIVKLAAYYSLIRKAFLRFSRLHTLKLLVHDPHLVKILHCGQLPSLRRFECHLTPSNSLISFLKGHPWIHALQLSHHENTTLVTEECPVHLPKLQYFSGNGQSLPAVIFASKLYAAIVSWDVIDTAPDLAISALERSSRDSLVLLSCRRRGWNMDLIQAISLRLPNLLSLHISNVLVVDSHPTESYLAVIGSILQRFIQLQRLKINCIDVWQMGEVACEMDEDFATVTGWGLACPSLMEIALPHSDSISWFKAFENIWVPDTKHAAGRSWLYNAAILKRYRWEVLMDGLEARLDSISANPNEYADPIAAVRLYCNSLSQAKDDTKQIQQREKASDVGALLHSRKG
ncbi:hypothetical protein B0H34DRAFT_833832 [Crassisporium funariophilum]|nr:hypothetical protein B0H34DRAFT_833832 [Crassisporium funariophilum]